MRGEDITAGLLLWYCAVLLRSEMDSRQLLTLCFTLTEIFLCRKAKINLLTTIKLSVFMSISCLKRSRRFWTSWRLRTRHSARHSLDARNFKENINKKYLGERLTKEVVIIRIENYFSAFHWGMKCRLNYIKLYFFQHQHECFYLNIL